MFTPPYAAYARPANRLSIRVSRSAESTRLATPATPSHGDLPSRNQVQNAKQPAISSTAAATMNASEYIGICVSLALIVARLLGARLRSRLQSPGCPA